MLYCSGKHDSLTMKEEETMSLAIHPLKLGELETDFSTLPTHDPEVYTLYPEGIE